MDFSIQEFNTRRQKLLASMANGIAILPTAPEAVRNRDSYYPYRFDSYFYYLTGFIEPESLLVLIAGSEPKSILFCRDKTLSAKFGMDFVMEPNQLKQLLVLMKHIRLIKLMR